MREGLGLRGGGTIEKSDNARMHRGTHVCASRRRVLLERWRHTRGGRVREKEVGRREVARGSSESARKARRRRERVSLARLFRESTGVVRGERTGARIYIYTTSFFLFYLVSTIRTRDGVTTSSGRVGSWFRVYTRRYD